MNKARSADDRRSSATRRRIVDAAGRLFAAHGFNGVGFREIAAKAGVSLQMPNHHFGTKQRLFAECVRHAFRKQLAFSALFSNPPPTSPSGARRAIAAKVRASFLVIVPPSGRPSWAGDLVGRALTENLEESLAAMQEGLQPARQWFLAALRQVRPGLTPQEFMLWYSSLWAQVSFYVTARPAILSRLDLKRYDPALVRAAADHLVKVMLGQLD